MAEPLTTPSSSAGLENDPLEEALAAGQHLSTQLGKLGPGPHRDQDDRPSPLDALERAGHASELQTDPLEVALNNPVVGAGSPALNPSFVEGQRGMEPPTTVLGKAVDVLARPQYGVAKLVDTLLYEPGMSFGKALAEGLSEVVAPDERLSFRDIIGRASPEYANAHPVWTTILGLAADIATDPLTYMSFGVGPLVTKVPRVTRAGIQRGARVASAFKKTSAVLPDWLKGGLRRDFLSGAKSAEQLAARSVGLENSQDVLEIAARFDFKRIPKKYRSRAVKFQERLGELRDVQKSPGFLANVNREVVRKQGSHVLNKRGEKKLTELIREAEERAGVGGIRTDEFAVGAKLEARASAESRLSRMLQSPELEAELTKPAAAIRLGRTTIVTKKQLGKLGAPFSKLAEMTGLDRLGAAIDEIPGIARMRMAVVHAFNRNAKLPKEYLDARRSLEAEHIRMTNEVLEDTRKLFGRFSKEERDHLGRTMAQIEEAVQADGMTPYQAAKRATEILQENKIDGELREAYVGFRTTMERVAEAEKEAGILGSLIGYYSPRKYDIVVEGDTLQKTLAGARRSAFRQPSEFLPAGQERKFATLAEAERFVDPLTGESFRPVHDAGALYAMRVLESRRALSNKLFNEHVKRLFPGLTVDRHGIIKVGDAGAVMEFYGVKSKKRMDALLKSVASDMKYVDEGLYNKSTPEEMNILLQTYDRALSIFRKSATVLRIGFGARQTVSNAAQNYLTFGTRSLNPTNAWRAMQISWGQALGWGADHVAPFRTGLGEVLTGPMLDEEMKSLGILRNQVGVLGPSSPTHPRRMGRLLEKTDRIGGGNGAPSKEARGGLRQFFQGLSRFTEWPAHIEDMGRATAYINARQMGQTAAEAADTVARTLFDYQHGLSQVEQRWLRRVVPFYSFQRFAIPLVARAAAHTPGRITNAKRTAEALMISWNKIAGGDALTDSERRVLPGWILEQPHTFQGWNDAMEAKFRTFNNFSPIEVFHFLETDGKGEINVKESLMKFGLAQLTPFLKVPIELVTGRQFFTDRVIDRNRTRKDVDPDSLLRNMAGLLVAQFGGGSIPALIGGQAAAETLNRLAPDFAEKTLGTLIGYEKGVDPRTGKETAYFNPFYFFSLTNALPAMNEAVRQAHQRATPMDAAMSFLFGINTFSVDLKQQAAQRRREARIEITRRTRNVKEAALEQRMRAYQDSLAELQTYVLDVRQHFTEIRDNEIRGANPTQE